MTNKMLFRTESRGALGIPTIAVSVAATEEAMDSLLMRAQLDSGSEANIVAASWSNTLRACGIVEEDIPPVTVG